MSLAAWVAMLAICLTAGRGWFGDLFGQVIFGAMLGLAILEGFARSVCLLIYDRAAKIPGAFAPLLLFAIPIYALTKVELIYCYSIGFSALAAALVGLVIFWGEICNDVVAGMNDFTNNISHHGG